jgi:2-dehydropantoate 2-reductase
VEANVRILVMGAGGIGGYYGARLAQAGNDVTLVARGAHLEAMRARGLGIRERGETTVTFQPIQAVRYPADAGAPVDFVLFAVKAYDTHEAAEAILPVVGPDTSVLPIQNGVDSTEAVAGVIGAGHVLAGTASLSATITEPGIVERLSETTQLTIGEAFAARSPRVERIAAAFHAAGIMDALISDDAQRALWEKFMFLAPCATINSVTGLPTGDLRSIPDGRDTVLAMQREIRAVGLAAGMNLPPETAAKAERVYLGLRETHSTSMQRDFAAGKRVELDVLAGSVVRRGKALGVPTPIFTALYAILRVRALKSGLLSA